MSLSLRKLWKSETWHLFLKLWLDNRKRAKSAPFITWLTELTCMKTLVIINKFIYCTMNLIFALCPCLVCYNERICEHVKLKNTNSFSVFRTLSGFWVIYTLNTSDWLQYPLQQKTCYLIKKTKKMDVHESNKWPILDSKWRISQVCIPVHPTLCIITHKPPYIIWKINK